MLYAKLRPWRKFHIGIISADLGVIFLWGFVSRKHTRIMPATPRNYVQVYDVHKEAEYMWSLKSISII